MNWQFFDSRMTEDHLGFLPGFFIESDPRPAAQQIAKRYVGGWHPLKGFKLSDNNVLTYPGDPPMPPLAGTRLRDELILFYPHAWLAIVQPDRSFEVSRVD